MQNSHLKLKEIIWEVTGECHNGCAYCGSKGVRSKKTSDETILEILNKIVEYPPEQIDISGGDPLLVELKIHEEITRKLKKEGVICKIIVNPRSLLNKHNIITEHCRKIQLYDWVGISINSKKDLEMFRMFLGDYATNAFRTEEFKKFTIITNFNIQNLYEFDLIEKFVKENDCLWTIQFTIYDDKNNPLALYVPENEPGFEYLQEKYNSSKAKIILSDNIRNDIGCGAGLNSIGVTSDGITIPCLSMRSWIDETEIYRYDSILCKPLKEIWITGFEQQRFECFKCCKDACKNKFLNIKNRFYFTEKKNDNIIEETAQPEDKSLDEFLSEFDKTEEKHQLPLQPYTWPGVVMYGVTPGNVYAYATPTPNDFVAMYAVSLKSTTFYPLSDDTIFPLDNANLLEDDLPF